MTEAASSIGQIRSQLYLAATVAHFPRVSAKRRLVLRPLSLFQVNSKENLCLVFELVRLVQLHLDAQSESARRRPFDMMNCLY